MFRFGSSEFLYAFVAVPWLVLFLWYAFRARRRALEGFAEAELVRRLAAMVSRRRQLMKAGLLVATVALLVTALARPQFGTRLETARREGQDIVVALDLSASMLAEDVAPSRLEKAKHAVGRLIDRLEGDRIGLVAFAGDAFVQAPLTVDYAAATMFLNAMEPDLLPVPGTNLGRALQVALDAFDPREEQHRVLIVITDGEDHEGEITEAVDRARDDAVRIYTVGIGSVEGVPIPDIGPDGARRGFQRDENGEVVTTRLDEETLQGIARDTGGKYYRATAGESELDLLGDEIAAMTGRELDAQQFTQFEEQYQIFLGGALLLLFVECFVPERRRMKTRWAGRFQ
jgi:Ca-activated chloride channel family protein